MKYDLSIFNTKELSIIDEIDENWSIVRIDLKGNNNCKHDFIKFAMYDQTFQFQTLFKCGDVTERIAHVGCIKCNKMLVLIKNEKGKSVLTSGKYKTAEEALDIYEAENIV